MDLGVAPCCSRHLAGFPPSTSPPPLGERNRQFGQTTSHFDSHTMGDHEDEIPEMSSPPHEGGGIFAHMIHHMNNPHDLVMIPHSQVAGIGYWVTRLIMNPQALVIFIMAYLISLHMIWYIMSRKKLNLALCLGALLFLSMRRDLGALVTLHLPSW